MKRYSIKICMERNKITYFLNGLEYDVNNSYLFSTLISEIFCKQDLNKTIGE